MMNDASLAGCLSFRCLPNPSVQVDEYSATLGGRFSAERMSCVTFGCESKDFNDSAVG